MDTKFLIAGVLGLLLIVGFVFVSAAQETEVESDNDAGLSYCGSSSCTGSCTAESNCGSASCGATKGGSCGCGRR